MKTKDFSPIADQGELQTGGGFFSKRRRGRETPPASPGFARVLLDGEGVPLDELTAGQKYWSRARSWVKVDIRSHPLEYDISFPDPSGLAGFVAVVDVSATVTKPAGAVREAAEGVEEIIRPALQNAIRTAHTDSSASAENRDPVAVLNDLRVSADRNLETLIGTIPAIPDWLTAKVTSVRVRLDEATEAHLKELMSRVRAVDLADADNKSDATKARHENLIREIREQGFEGRLADPERRALIRIAAEPSRENIDRVVGQFDQIEAQGRAAIVEFLRDAVKNGYFAEDDAIYNAIRALERQTQGLQPLGAGAEPRQVEPPAETFKHLVEAEPVEADARSEIEVDESSDDEQGEGRSDSNWKE